MNNQKRESIYINASNKDALRLKPTNTDINIMKNNDPYDLTSKNANMNLIKTDVKAIDDLSSLLIDISSSIARYDNIETKEDNKIYDTFSLLEKLKTSDLVKINEALDGWKNKTSILAPSYKPGYKEIKAIFDMIHYNKSISKATFNLINRSKACASNFQNLIINGKVELHSSESYKKQTEGFINDLQYGMFMLNKLFSKLNFNKTEKKLFHIFVSRTATILFNLGFADSINHSIQVARKCIIEAYRRNLSKPEILQAAMVGWIHDPKFPGDYSWNNLSTHPIIASAIALDVLTQPDFHKQLAQYLRKANIDDRFIKNVEFFVKGVVEAVAINNDSKFVLDNAIFKRPVWAPGLPESGGVLDQISSMSSEQLVSLGIKNDSEDIVNDITKIALDRFYAPSNMKKPASFNKDIIKLLKHIQVETGFIGITADSFKKVCHYLSVRYHFITAQSLMQTFNQILSGEIQDKQFIKEFCERLNELNKANNNVYITIKVSADKLFSHHDEMKYAPKAALVLAIADRLLLSPHKILEAGVQNTILGRLSSFMESFEDNIMTLPKSAQRGGKIFQRDLYVSILKAIDELTGNNNFLKFEQTEIAECSKYQPLTSVSSKLSNVSVINNQIKILEYIIKEKEYWYNSRTETNYAEINPKNREDKEFFTMITNLIKKHYDFTAEQSPEMFGFIRLEKPNIIEKLLMKI